MQTSKASLLITHPVPDEATSLTTARTLPQRSDAPTGTPARCPHPGPRPEKQGCQPIERRDGGTAALPAGVPSFGFGPKHLSRRERPPRTPLSLGRRREVCTESVSSREAQDPPQGRASRCLCCGRHEALRRGLGHSGHRFAHRHRAPPGCQPSAARVGACPSGGQADTRTSQVDGGQGALGTAGTKEGAGRAWGTARSDVTSAQGREGTVRGSGAAKSCDEVYGAGQEPCGPGLVWLLLCTSPLLSNPSPPGASQELSFPASLAATAHHVTSTPPIRLRVGGQRQGRRVGWPCRRCPAGHQVAAAPARGRAPKPAALAVPEVPAAASVPVPLNSPGRVLLLVAERPGGRNPVASPGPCRARAVPGSPPELTREPQPRLHPQVLPVNLTLGAPERGSSSRNSDRGAGTALAAECLLRAGRCVADDLCPRRSQRLSGLPFASHTVTWRAPRPAPRRPGPPLHPKGSDACRSAACHPQGTEASSPAPTCPVTAAQLSLFDAPKREARWYNTGRFQPEGLGCFCGGAGYPGHPVRSAAMRQAVASSLLLPSR